MVFLCPKESVREMERERDIYILLTKTVQNMAAIGKRLQGRTQQQQNTQTQGGGGWAPGQLKGGPGGGGTDRAKPGGGGGARQPEWP